METGRRLPLLIVELLALGLTLALIPDAGARVVLGLLLGILISRTAWSGAGRAEGPPEGLPDRRADHLFRHWLNVLIKKIREFHAVCQAIREERVNPAVGEMRIREIETQLRDLVAEVTELAKPPRLRRRRSRRAPRTPARGRPGGA